MESLIKFFADIGVRLRKVFGKLDLEKGSNFLLASLFSILILVYQIPSFLFRRKESFTNYFIGDDAPQEVSVLPIASQIIVLLVFAFILYKLVLTKKIKVTVFCLFLFSFLHLFTWGILIKSGWNSNFLLSPLFFILFWLVGLAGRYSDETSKMNGLKQAVSQYVNPQILERILTNPKSLRLGGQTRTMTVLFTDIRNFTTISENSQAKDLITFVNDYFNSITQTILRNDGTIDKFAGDSLMAFWNAPLADPEHSLRACITALKIVQDVSSFNEEHKKKKGFPRIETGIGINTGRIIVGNVGSSRRFDYTVLGDDVNVASRLESLTKIYKVPIMLGHNTVLALKRVAKFSEFSIRLLDIVKVKGKGKNIGIYELMGPREEKLEGFVSIYEEAFNLYKEGKFNEASSKFIQILSERNDYPSKMMLVRCYQFMEEAPKADWDGTWEWGSK
ncbi:adenylate/guanylate cyclase domain-containing protein [Candidatus Dojkabacteria bacterium]|nr:adenylate/guanylate cyclase domain-containing protein [Candidatus Dojkabacteria bacterium]